MSDRCRCDRTTATAVSINVTFSADVDESTIESIKSNIRSYLRDVSFANGYVSYAKIGQTILNTDGVDDYSNLKINSPPSLSTASHAIIILI